MEQSKSAYAIGIVGATGAVGEELVKCLHLRRFPLFSLHLFASSRSAGKSVSTAYGTLQVNEFSVAEVRKLDFVFLAVSGSFAHEFAPLIVADGGPVVIDNSSAFRYEPDVPLVVPEVNAHTLHGAKLIANPNCTTAIAAVCLWPLHQKFGIKKLIMSTYQAASGAGAEGMEELREGTQTVLQGGEADHKVFSYPLPFNLIPQIDSFQDNLYTKEEMKVVWETRKIFGLSDDEISISCTAVRVPIMRAHSESITIETHSPVTVEDARRVLGNSVGVRVVDDPANSLYPMPRTSSSSFDVEVGRLRQSLVFGSYGLDLFISGDQLLRGAALNAVLIAEALLDQQQQRRPIAPAGYIGPKRDDRPRTAFYEHLALGTSIVALIVLLLLR